MIAPTPQNEALVSELTALLDDEIELLTTRLGQMDQLSSTIVSRDNDAMEPLLDRMELTQRRQQSTDEQLDRVRRQLASETCVPAEQMRLSRLVDELQPPVAEEISRRRRQLVELSGRLRQSHLQTVLLLAESARVNRLMLATLFPTSQPVTTYGAGGADQWRPDTGLVDTEQ